ncbi:probable polygalacturonase At3g15720 [Aristolochia californica]|uniref:probable polygalacturonase At3g15720 n=1 Tax=Aristolochia californica TaxID=171875 RepID=UPI0035E0474A
MPTVKFLGALSQILLVAISISANMKSKRSVIFTVLFILSVAPFGSSYHNVFNVVDFGAVGNGKTDDTEAFKKAWAATCGSVGRYSTLIVPRGKTFLVNSYMFSGGCKASSIYFTLDGNLVAPPRGRISNIKSWITFYSVNSLTIIGSGQMDGQGYSWWPKKCFEDPQGCQINIDRPTLLSFESCNMLQVLNVRLINSPRNHIVVNNCNHVFFSGISISAPRQSPNTDGINIGSSSFVTITKMNIASGDDCITFLPGSSNINVSHITCNPGHGISVGSVYTGKVEKVLVEHCYLSNTQNGVRIKTKQGGSGYVRDIHFRDIHMTSVSNPIIIDQYYFSPINLTSAVAISNVEFSDIRGTTQGDLAIKLACSQSVPCRDVHLWDVNLRSVIKNKPVSSYCLSVHGPRCPNCSPRVPCLG